MKKHVYTLMATIALFSAGPVLAMDELAEGKKSASSKIPPATQTSPSSSEVESDGVGPFEVDTRMVRSIDGYTYRLTRHDAAASLDRRAGIRRPLLIGITKEWFY